MAIRGHTDTGFAATLRAAVEQMREASGADIVALYPYDEETGNIYAPVASGLSEGDIVRALSDLNDQLRRFRADEAQDKTPEDLLPAQYGPSAWLLAMRRPLVSTDARQQVESSFVRRHHIRAVVGLPLLVASRVVGLLYLNYAEGAVNQQPVDVAAPDYMERMETAAAAVAATLNEARYAAQVTALRAVSALVTGFSALPSDVSDESAAAARLEAALQRTLAAVRTDAAALYIPAPGGTRMMLVAQQGIPTPAAMLPTTRLDAIVEDETLRASLAEDDLYPVAALTPRGQGAEGVLVLADRDAFNLDRRLPLDRDLLQTAADLLGGILNTGRLIEELGDTSRTLGAVTRLSTQLLQPGATQEETLRTAVASLTDPALPELDFEFAALFLLESTPEGGLTVCQSAGATTSPHIDSQPDSAGGAPSSRRVPSWAVPGGRVLAEHDVLAYVAKHRRALVVSSTDAPTDDHFVSGYPEDRLERWDVPILRTDGSTAGSVHAARLREAADRAPLLETDDESTTYRLTDEITLDADLFAAYGHASLVRVFVPFGSDISDGRATGVLEAGYHISRRQQLQRVEIEALRACAATVAVAVETARLYEDVTHRAKQLEIVTEVSRAIATSIDLEQTLRLVARNMARAVDASLCLIALLDEDGSAWYGAAASDQEDVWRQRRVERPGPSIIFDVADRNRPLLVEDAVNHELVSPYMARLLGIRSLIALPLSIGEGEAIGAVILGQRERSRVFTADEVERAAGLAEQATMAIRNARVHAREEEEHHIQKDVVLVGFGQWGQKGYKHLVLLKNFFNFRVHVVEVDFPGRREALAEAEEMVLANGDLFYWDTPEAPARTALEVELEPSCYVITYIVTPAETHLPMLKLFYDLSNVVLIEKPLGAPPDEYREFLDHTDGSVQIVAADHYWFKMEIRLLELLLTEERDLRAFLDEIEEVEIEILEEQVPSGSGAQIGMIADLIPHAFAILSLLTPLERLRLAPHNPLQIGRYEPRASEHETYARLVGSFDMHGRSVRVTIDVGKGVTNAKSIKLSGERRMGGRRSFYKFDFNKGEAIDGTQSALRAATRPIRQPGVPDNAHLSMLRHVVEKRHPAVGILSIREALRANARIQQLEQIAMELIAADTWIPYRQGQRPLFAGEEAVQLAEIREMNAQTVRR